MSGVLTDRGRGLLGAGAVLWLLGRVFGAPALSMAATAAVALVVLALAYTWSASAHLSVRRRVRPARLAHGGDGRVELEVRNVGRLPTSELEIDEGIPRALEGPGRLVLAPLPAGTAATVRYRLHGGQRGRFAVGPAAVRLGDPFGIATRRLRVGGEDELVVLPPVHPLPAGVPLPGQRGGGAGSHRPLHSGDELASVREYVRGDDLRKVHWRTTAHRGRLMVRQDEARHGSDATLVVDARLAVHRGRGAGASFEATVAAAASAVAHLAARGYHLHLATPPAAPLPAPLPAAAALERLAVLRPAPSGELGALWRDLRTASAGGGLVAVVALPDPADLRAMVRAGRAFQGRLAVLVDTASFGGPRWAAPDTEMPSRHLRAAGWRVTVLTAGQPLAHAWERLRVPPRGEVPTPVGPGTGGRA